METKVLFFGELADLVGNHIMCFQKSDNVTSLEKELLSRFPALKNKTYRIAVNMELISGNRDLKVGDEIAILPPFAGG